MSEKKHSKVGGLFRAIFNVRAWINADDLRKNYSDIKSTVQKMFIPQEPTRVSTFKNVVMELNLTDEQLQSKLRAFKRLAYLSLFMAFLALSYAIYHIVLGNYNAIFLSISVGCIGLALAFRYHFWAYQIKRNKLGCSVREWFLDSFKMGGKR